MEEYCTLLVLVSFKPLSGRYPSNIAAHPKLDKLTTTDHASAKNPTRSIDSRRPDERFHRTRRRRNLDRPQNRSRKLYQTLHLLISPVFPSLSLFLVLLNPEKLNSLFTPSFRNPLVQSLGISRVVITSSFAAVTDFSKGGPFRSYTYTSHDWNPTTLSEALSPGKPGPFVYSASKTLAEQAAHEFSKENPSVSVTSMNPPMIYSSPLPGTVKDKKGINTSSNAIYGLIEGDKDREVPWNRLPLFCATEDVAKAHRKALEVDVEKVRGQRVSLTTLFHARNRARPSSIFF